MNWQNELIYFVLPVICILVGLWVAGYKMKNINNINEKKDEEKDRFNT